MKALNSKNAATCNQGLLKSDLRVRVLTKGAADAILCARFQEKQLYTINGKVQLGASLSGHKKYVKLDEVEGQRIRKNRRINAK